MSTVNQVLIDQLETLEIKFEEEIVRAPTQKLVELGRGLNMENLTETMRKSEVLKLLRDYVSKSWGEEIDQNVQYMTNLHAIITRTLKADDEPDASQDSPLLIQAGKGLDDQEQHQQPRYEQHGGHDPTHHTARNEEATGAEVLGLIRALADANIAQRRQLKIMGVIGDAKDAKHINYTNLMSQVADGRASGFKDDEIARAIKKAIAANSHLRTYFDSVETMELGKMLSILRDFFQEKSASELFAELGQLCQNPTEKSTDFLLRAMQIRQRTTSAASAEGNLYDTKLVQGTFIRALKTGLREESIRAQLAPHLNQSKPDDSVLLREANLADLEYEEKMKKQKRDKRVTIAQASVNPNPTYDDALKPILEGMSLLQRQMNEMQQQTRSRDEGKQSNPPNSYQRGATSNNFSSRSNPTDNRGQGNNYAGNNKSYTGNNNYSGNNNSYSGSNKNSYSGNNNRYAGNDSYARNYKTDYKTDYRCNQCRMDDTPRCSHCWRCGSIEHRSAECTASKN